ncbi:Heme oxygenase [Planctomycetes bacterium Poly30]|uniref:Heme oxygenase n=1 Tax=Saltatorellus ferox TaxID=2528018 RepID=A0A518EKI8_9BACT|nr:Heme oxygenase [Planctomycetes bacterium Poly30]
MTSPDTKHAAALPSTLLRATIAGEHTSIEQLAVARAMVEGTIERETYLTLLQHMLALHTVVESDVLPALPESIASPSMARVPALLRDLAALGGARKPMDAGSVDRIARFGSSLATETPLALLGVIYVLEGSRMGSMVLYEPLARALSIQPSPGAGLDYHMEGMGETPLRFRALKAQIDAALEDTGDATSAASVAGRTMALLHELYSSISRTMSNESTETAQAA